MLRHPAHWIALGFGSGLSPCAPGTVGTLWAWAGLPACCDRAWATLQLGRGAARLGCVVGWWACTVTARHLGTADPGAIVWDEVVAFWLVLWLVTPAGFWAQAVAFALFRFFDAAKPGPVAWADRLFKLPPRPADRLGAGLRHPVRRPGGGAVHAAGDRAVEVRGDDALRGRRCSRSARRAARARLDAGHGRELHRRPDRRGLHRGGRLERLVRARLRHLLATRPRPSCSACRPR